VKYLCIPTHTYIHTFTHTRIHAYIHTYIHTYIHIYIHTYIHTCIHTDIHTYIRTYVHTYTRTYIYTYTHTHVIHTYIHTYIHTHTHTHTHTLCLSMNGLSLQFFSFGNFVWKKNCSEFHENLKNASVSDTNSRTKSFFHFCLLKERLKFETLLQSNPVITTSVYTTPRT
jgi:hypothetical protein